MSANSYAQKVGNPGLTDSRNTWLYFIGIDGLPFVKIGKATNLYSRLKELQIGSPHELSLIASVEVPKCVERLVHIFLAPQRHRGEWFKTGKELDLVLGGAREGELGIYRVLGLSEASIRVLVNHRPHKYEPIAR